MSGLKNWVGPFEIYWLVNGEMCHVKLDRFGLDKWIDHNLVTREHQPDCRFYIYLPVGDVWYESFNGERATQTKADMYYRCNAMDWIPPTIRAYHMITKE